MVKEKNLHKDNRETVVNVKNVAKTFRLPKEHSSELKQAFINRIRGVKGYTDLNVLKNISFDVKKGDFFGIVGRNGSGKSTLLKLLAGIYQPTKGNIKTKGKIVPFIELGVGFNPELTGRENVYMNGAMLGFSNSEVDEMYDEIVDFAELPDFMDQKLKNYSSGMQVRLAFSIAIKAQGDILILDEVLAVGDEAFQRKCANFFNQIKRDKTKTVILVTHDMSSVRQYCNKAIFIEKGEVIHDGNPNIVADDYSEMFLQQESKTTTSIDGKKRLGSGKISYENIDYKLSKNIFKLEFDIKNNTENTFSDVTMGFDFTINKEIIAGFDTRFTDDYAKISIDPYEVKHFILDFSNKFGNHEWELNMNMTVNSGNDIVDHIKPVLNFRSNNVKYHPVFKTINIPKIIEEDKK